MTGQHQPRQGDIGLVRGAGFVGWLIRTVTRSPYAHAFLYAGGGAIIEAEPNGAVERKLHYVDIYWCGALSESLTYPQRAAVVAWARSRLGTPYSWVDDAEIGFTDLFGWAPRWMRRRLASDRTLMCSQLCVAAYRANGRELFPGKPDGAEAPSSLWRLNRYLEGRR